MAKPSGITGAKKIPSTAAAARGAAPEDADEALVQQFTRDLRGVLRHVRDDDARDPERESDEVGYYGPVAQKLVVLVDKLLNGTAELAAHKKFRLLLDFGDKFYALQEFRAASAFFYSTIVDAVDAADGSSSGSTHANTSEADKDAKQIRAEPPAPAATPSSEVFIRALYGDAMCAFHVQRRRDPIVRHPGTLEKMLAALRLLQKGMEAATALELAGSPQRFSWLVLNGSILIFSIARPLSALGFAQEVVAFLKWTILSLESVVALSTTKYILWRLQFFAATCECYELMASQAAASNESAREATFARAAFSCAEYAQKTVARLKKEEELDMPLPKDVVAVLSQAQAVTGMLVARANAVASREGLSKRQIEAAFSSSSVGTRVRIAVDTVESLARSDRESVGVLAPPSTPRLSEQIDDLLDYVLEIVAPMLPGASDEDTSGGSSATSPGQTEPLQLAFPLVLHMMLLPHLWRLGKIAQLALVVEAARTRLRLTSEALSDVDQEQCRCELDLFAALGEIKTPTDAHNDQTEHHQTASEPAQSLKKLPSEDALLTQRVLLRFAKALTTCLTLGSGAMGRTKRDLVLAAAMVLWREGAQPIVKRLDASELSEFPKPLAAIVAKLLLAIHLAFVYSDVDDLLLHGLVGIRLVSMLRLRRKFRLATQTVRALLERIDRKRDELSLSENHFEATTAVASGGDARGNAVAMSCATISCAVDHTLSRSDASSHGDSAAGNARDRVGVFGTGSQFASARQDLCCLQADLLLQLFQLELEEASAVDALPTSAGNDQPASPFEDLSLVNAMEEKLSLECRKNGYHKALLLIQRMRHHPTQTSESAALADQALKLIGRMEAHERELQARVKRIALGSTLSSESPAFNSASSAPSDANVVLPPVVVLRSSTAITVCIVPFRPTLPSLRKRVVAYYMVFAKPSGVGTDVSLNNNALPGTAEPVYPSCSQRTEFTVGGLIPNESYVFAVAAFDSSHEVIQGIGQTSTPVVALNPLPVELCYGYLAQACYELNLLPSATKAATTLYNSVVSRDAASRVLWKASSFYRHALKRDVVAKLPVPVLNLVVQAVLILCHDEAGAPDRDGMLHDPEHRSLLSRQVEVLEACRRVAIGVELASAAANVEAIRVLCFKGYRLLLPLLHLHQSDGLTFAPLLTFYQALLTIPGAEWDADTKSVFARVSFELLRVASSTRVFGPVVYPSLVSETLHRTEQQKDESHSGFGARSNEFQSMCEVIAVREALSRPAAAATALQTAPSTSASKSAPASKSTTPAGSASSPEPTPRPNDETALPPLTELLQQANFSVPAALSALESHAASSSDIRQIEYVCKLAVVALQRGDESTAEACLAALKLKGRDDDLLYLWGGEVFFLQALLQYRKLVAACAAGRVVDATKGPNFDSVFDLLHPRASSGEKLGAREVLSSPEAVAGESETAAAITSQEQLTTGDALARTAEHELHDAFSLFLDRVSAACEMFRCAKAWQALQASCQYVWSAIWVAWVSPDRFRDDAFAPLALSSPSARWLDRLAICVDTLLDMVETVIVAVKQQQQQQRTTFVATLSDASQTVLAMNRSLLQTSFASTAVVASATSVMNADVTWIVGLVSFAMQAFSAQEKWELVVRVGKKFHSLLGSDEQSGGSRFSERNFPIMLFAQRQLLSNADALLAVTARDLATFVREFAEAEAKKKKKKSRLVVEEVLTPEELEFRATRAAMEQTIERLTQQRDCQRDELQLLSDVHEKLAKSTNKCVQALDTIHELVETFMRGHKEDAALRNQIVSAYSHCILLSRQKRQQRLLCQAYQELGDFHLATSAGDAKLAVKSWLEGLDNAFGALNVVQSWREVLARSSREHPQNGVSGAEQIQGDSFWVALTSCTALSKLILHSTGANCFLALEYALMAATVFCRLFACSLPHPTRAFLFGSYELSSELWPGRELLNAERVSPLALGVALILVPEVLLQYEHYAVSAMPVIAAYEHLARFVLESPSHVANARRLRVEALSQCGRISEALNVLCQLVDGVEIASTREQLKPSALLSAVSFDDSKCVRDGANAAALAWFAAIDVNKLHAELSRIHSTPLVLEILVTLLRLVVRLACHDSNLADGSSPLRAAAEKIALAMLQAVDHSTASAATPPDSDATYVPTWDSVFTLSIRNEVVLLQSCLAFADGEWDAARELSTKALEACVSVGRATECGVGSLDLEQHLKFCLLRRRSTFVAKCRLRIMQCDLALGRFHAVLAQSEIAVLECRESGEDHVTEQLQALRCNALVFTGEGDEAEAELEQLRAAATTRFTNCSLPFARMLLMTATVLHARALLTADYEVLDSVRDRLVEAEHVLDRVLEREGWIGVGCDDRAEKWLNVYRPAIESFVFVKAALAQTLVECAIGGVSETVAQRQRRVLRTIDEGLRAAAHTTRRVGSATAQLLLLKGSTLKKLLVNHHRRVQFTQEQHAPKPSSGDNNDAGDGSDELLDDARAEELFGDVVASLTASVETSMLSGGYDRRLVRTALVELVDLYGHKLVSGKEDEHVQAAFHYLSLAVATQSHECVLVETQELQSGTIATADKLPPFISHAISPKSSSSAAPPLDSKRADPAAKKAGAAPPPGAGDPTRSPPVDVARLINLYLRLQREQYVLPAHCSVQQDSVQWLHAFLLQNHSSYASSCCLPGLPTVPSDDPEIKASLVCAQWGRDLTPAIPVLAAGAKTRSATPRPAAAKLTMFFTLGTTRIDILCAEDRVAAATRRMEEFLRAPLLSRKTGLDEAQVGDIRTSLSCLRTEMEDDESLVIDRSVFESNLRGILRRIQCLLCSSRVFIDHQEEQSEGVSADPSPQALWDIRDVFGNPIQLQCTLGAVRSLESLFTVASGVNTADNVLCYFLRDLLEQEDGAK